jgi:hypothetical protein
MALEYPNYADKVIFVELLAEGGTHTVPAEPTHLDAWIGSAGIQFTTTIDPPGVGQRIIAEVSPRENTFLVELSTMKIVQRVKSPSQLYPALDAL